MTLRLRARALHADGAAVAEVARQLKLPYRTVRDWCHLTFQTDPGQPKSPRPCWACDTPRRTPEKQEEYAYLLGLYLGDGYLATSMRVPVLRIACAEAYPALIDACERAMRATLAKAVQRVQKEGCVAVQAYSMHWPCLFPQHGPGRKHERKIALTDWQQQIVDEHPKPFVRGLFHSDGCRVVNHVTVRGKRYAYPRYFFSNESADIMALCAAALDRIGAQWRLNRRNSLSVARASSVALLDTFIGPKD